MDNESLFETLERFKDLVRQCPHHNLPEWTKIQIYYQGLNQSTHQLIDSIVRGSLRSKNPGAVKQLIEEIAINNY